jgi:hypothetical protein
MSRSLLPRAGKGSGMREKARAVLLKFKACPIDGCAGTFRKVASSPKGRASDSESCAGNS